jgi:hypothetical protein
MVAGKLRVALRGKHVDGVGAPQAVHVSEDVGVELPVVPICFAAQFVGPYDGRGSNTARAYVDVVGVDEFPEFSKFVHQRWGPGRKVTEYNHHYLIILVPEYFLSAQER